MIALRRLLIVIGVALGILIVGAMEGGFTGSGIVALLVSFIAVVGGVWATTYAMKEIR